jgi:hypothetical protein
LPNNEQEQRTAKPKRTIFKPINTNPTKLRKQTSAKLRDTKFKSIIDEPKAQTN